MNATLIEIILALVNTVLTLITVVVQVRTRRNDRQEKVIDEGQNQGD